MKLALEESKDSLAAKTVEFDRIVAESEVLKTRLTQSDTESSRFNMQTFASEAEISSLKLQILKLETDNKSTIIVKENEIKLLHEKISEISSNENELNKEKDLEIDGLQKELDAIKEKKDQLLNENETKENELKRMKLALEESKDSLAAKTVEFDRIVAESEVLKTRLTQSDTESSRFYMQTFAREAEISSLKLQILKLETDNKSTIIVKENEIKLLHEKISEISSNENELNKEKDLEIDGLKKELDAIKEKKDQLLNENETN